MAGGNLERAEYMALQTVMAKLGYYKKAIDGFDGPGTQGGVDIIIRNAKMTEAVTGWDDGRKSALALQIILHTAAEYDGPLDGWFGTLSEEALVQYLSKQAGTSAAVVRAGVPSSAQAPNLNIPRQRDCAAFYGDPNKNGVAPHIKKFKLPFAMRIDWNLAQSVSTVSLHEKCGDSYVAALQEVQAEYGDAEMRRLGIDRYAGGYVHRKMRGGSSWSMHAYGCAVDHYAQPNGLRTKAPQALFSQAPYVKFLDIMEAHGWLNGGRLWGADYMHFQQARL